MNCSVCHLTQKWKATAPADSQYLGPNTARETSVRKGKSLIRDRRWWFSSDFFGLPHSAPHAAPPSRPQAGSVTWAQRGAPTGAGLREGPPSWGPWAEGSRPQALRCGLLSAFLGGCRAWWDDVWLRGSWRRLTGHDCPATPSGCGPWGKGLKLNLLLEPGLELRFVHCNTGEMGWLWTRDALSSHPRGCDQCWSEEIGSQMPRSVLLAWKMPQPRRGQCLSMAVTAWVTIWRQTFI